MKQILVIKKTLVLLFVAFYLPLTGLETLSQAQASACALQADGKLIVAGNGVKNNVTVLTIARYLTNGLLDSSFGISGYVTGIQMQLVGLAIQSSDGKIIVAGYATQNKVKQIVLVRYTSDGMVDASFGQSGVVYTTVDQDAFATSVTLDSAANIFVTGYVFKNGGSKLLLARYLSNGTLDSTFGNNGIVTQGMGYGAYANSVAILSSGKIVVGGFSLNVGSGEHFALAQFNSDGSLDTSFGSNGLVSTTIGKMSHIDSLCVQNDGKIVVAGFSDNNYVIARYLAAGDLDTTFGTNGIINRSLGAVAYVNAVALDANNNIVVAGFYDSQLLIARYTDSGVLDTTFNSTGEAILTYGTIAEGSALVIQQDGTIIVVGSADESFLLAKYLSSGVVDTAWGLGGITNEPSITVDQLVIRIWEQQPAGTNAGTFTAGGWQARTLNQTNATNSVISISNNQFTLDPGKYDISISAPAYRVGNHQARLQNLTDNVTVAYGTSVYSNSAVSGAVSNSIIDTQLILMKPTTFQVQHKCTITEANDGFGIAAGMGSAEIYTQVKINPMA